MLLPEQQWDVNTQMLSLAYEPSVISLEDIHAKIASAAPDKTYPDVSWRGSGTGSNKVSTSSKCAVFFVRSEKTKVKEKNEQAIRNGECTAIHYSLFSIHYNA